MTLGGLDGNLGLVLARLRVAIVRFCLGLETLSSYCVREFLIIYLSLRGK